MREELAKWSRRKQQEKKKLRRSSAEFYLTSPRPSQCEVTEIIVDRVELNYWQKMTFVQLWIHLEELSSLKYIFWDTNVLFSSEQRWCKRLANQGTFSALFLMPFSIFRRSLTGKIRVDLADWCNHPKRSDANCRFDQVGRDLKCSWTPDERMWMSLFCCKGNNHVYTVKVFFIDQSGKRLRFIVIILLLRWTWCRPRVGPPFRSSEKMS